MDKDKFRDKCGSQGQEKVAEICVRMKKNVYICIAQYKKGKVLNYDKKILFMSQSGLSAKALFTRTNISFQ